MFLFNAIFRISILLINVTITFICFLFPVSLVSTQSPWSTSIYSLINYAHRFDISNQIFISVKSLWKKATKTNVSPVVTNYLGYSTSCNVLVEHSGLNSNSHSQRDPQENIAIHCVCLLVFRFNFIHISCEVTLGISVVLRIKGLYFS